MRRIWICALMALAACGGGEGGDGYDGGTDAIVTAMGGGDADTGADATALAVVVPVVLLDAGVVAKIDAQILTDAATMGGSGGAGGMGGALPDASAGGAGGIVQAGGTGGGVASDGSFPSTQCEGWVSYSIPQGSCVRILGDFQWGSSCVPLVAKRCTTPENINQCNFRPRPDGLQCDGLAMIVSIKPLGPVTFTRHPLSPGGACSVTCAK
jgi:hypothetical protein